MKILRFLTKSFFTVREINAISNIYILKQNNLWDY